MKWKAGVRPWTHASPCTFAVWLPFLSCQKPDRSYSKWLYDYRSQWMPTVNHIYYISQCLSCSQLYCLIMLLWKTMKTKYLVWNLMRSTAHQMTALRKESQMTGEQATVNRSYHRTFLILWCPLFYRLSKMLGTRLSDFWLFKILEY